MKDVEEYRKINKSLSKKINYLQRKVAQLERRLSIKQARIEKMKEIFDLIIESKI